MNTKIKIFVACTLLLSVSAQFYAVHARGGDAAVGVLGGLAVGTMIGGAAASSNRHSSRAEHDAQRAQDKADRLERELDRRDIEHRLGSGRSMMTVLVVMVVVLLLAVIGLGAFVFRRKF